MAVDEEDVVDVLRAIINSSKGGLLLTRVNVDYKEAMGCGVPFKTLGYGTLEELLKKHSADFRLTGGRVEAKAKTESAHITSLVSRQQDVRRKGRPRLASHRRPVTSGWRSFVPQETPRRGGYNYPPRFMRQSEERWLVETTNSGNGLRTAAAETPVSLRQPRRAENGVQTAELVKKSLQSCGMLTRTIVNERAVQRDSQEPEEVDLFEEEAICRLEGHVVNDGPFKVIEPFESVAEAVVQSPPPSRAQARLIKARTSPLTVETAPSLDTLRISTGSPASLTTSSPSPPVFPPQATSPTHSPSPPIPQKAGGKPGGAAKRGSAQSRLANIKSAVQTKLAEPPRDVDKAVETPGERQLREACAAQGLSPPQYTILVREPKNQPKCYGCKIRIGEGLSVSSYPVETEDEPSAREVAAKKALAHLVDHRPQLTRTASQDIVISRITELVSHVYGVWTNKLPEMYKAKHSEELTPDWVELVRASRELELQQSGADATRQIVMKKEVKPASLATISLPTSKYWDVYIMCTRNTGEVLCRLIGEEYSDRYDDMMTQLEMRCMQGGDALTPVAPAALHPGGVYMVKVMETVSRVQVVSVAGDRARVVYLDGGEEEEEVDCGQLCHLDPDFLQVPPQALSVSLYGLENFAEDSVMDRLLLDTLLSKIYVAEVFSLQGHGSLGGPVASVVLWDTYSEVDFNVNQSLLDTVVRSIQAPTLARVGQAKEMYVSHVSDTCSVHLQECRDSVQRIQNLIKTQTASGLDRQTIGLAMTASSDVEPKKLYLVRCPDTGEFHRCRLTEVVDGKTVTLRLVDRGGLVTAAVTQLLPLSRVSPALVAVPPQAVPVVLANVPRAPAAALRLRALGLVGSATGVLVKVLSLGEGLIVEIFGREPPDNALFSINQILIADAKRDASVEAMRREAPAVAKPGGTDVRVSLPAPLVPKVGQDYEVYVTLAASPDLFTVQPLATRAHLYTMMHELQTHCTTALEPINESDAKVGRLYAVKHKDSNWYRCSLEAIHGLSHYSVHLCDFGDFLIVGLQDLAHLPLKFTKLPYQAIRARLAGVVPSDGDWTAQDSVYFQTLVIKKEFVAVVKDVGGEAGPASDSVTLGLVLIDTSTEEDIYIHELLLQHHNS